MDLKKNVDNLIDDNHVCNFKARFFSTPTWCTFCGGFIWWNLSDATVSGYQCDDCGAPAHTYCVSLINATLTKNEREHFSLLEEAQEMGIMQVECQHVFSSVFLTLPTWCSYCSTFIWGITPDQQKALVCSVHQGCKLELEGSHTIRNNDSHNIIQVVFKYPTWCAKCKSFIWNPFGWRCKDCGKPIHQTCKFEALSDKCTGVKPYSDKTVASMKFVPTRYLSNLWGNATSKQFPQPVQTQLNLLYAHSTACNLLEAEHEVSHYPSLSHFFKRNLKGGARIIEDDSILVSPVDGRLLNFGKINTSTTIIEQVKGIDINLVDFLGKESSFFKAIENQPSDSLKSFYYSVIYLAPGDYHGIHSPIDWRVTEYRHVPGHLFPVNSWATAIPNLLAMNERVVLNGEWKHGFFSYILVGAYNVGSIELKWEQDLHTNIKEHNVHSESMSHAYEKPLVLEQGEQMGFFNFGSTVVLIFEGPSDAQFVPPKGNVIKLGNAIFDYNHKMTTEKV